ncbi:MAG: bifunctional histidinol-phosphatase/imidazoleglycerol-phosphate dehydratase HisB [Bacteroidetes bacterium]|nr:bifunctional histidinol-phosphatase/imidazoleglycerol-phosphate dehydratase HisB [Bacteroidota bacterium]
MKKVLFVDRDGTLIVEPPDERIDSLEKLELIPGAIAGMRALLEAGFEAVMVTNQDDLGTRAFPQERFDLPHDKMMRIFEGEGISFAHVFICPHGEWQGCECRKPKTGMLANYLAENRVDMARSFVLGDRETDIGLARNLGCRGVRLVPGQPDVASDADFVARSFREACGYILRDGRTARVERVTSETAITVELALDGTGAYDIATGIGFFDHMLAQLARHSLIDMTIHARGDLDIDEHHTVEDTGLALGEAIRLAIGDKRGIGRYGFMLPMDEALAQAALDLGGRPYLVFDARFDRERVGELPTELVEDFFRAFSDGMRANINISATGRNDHHRIESIFKAVARALRMAVARDGRSGLPTTKGVL